MSDKTINRMLALVIFLVPLVVYLLTMAPTLVFWDSGEFIATAYILGIPHSPGTPLFTLVGRVFAMLPLPMNAAETDQFLFRGVRRARRAHGLSDRGDDAAVHVSRRSRGGSGDS